MPSPFSHPKHHFFIFFSPSQNTQNHPPITLTDTEIKTPTITFQKSDQNPIIADRHRRPPPLPPPRATATCHCRCYQNCSFVTPRQDHGLNLQPNVDNFSISLNQSRHRFSAPPIFNIVDDEPFPPPPRRAVTQRRDRNSDEARTPNDRVEAPSTMNERVFQCQTQSSTTRKRQEQTRELATPSYSSTDTVENFSPPDSPIEFV
ncbi:hypothetical protein J1N35_028392 [Gossypium stocksii]|uniref:Uncharacterized protein n=1 Tax=Gossypium stocksii TaxID=47602 RepID=A0A9D3UW01_9ROSI|nr:hypothetical protein J1N35_028392 [Gossypium stocksii]